MTSINSFRQALRRDSSMLLGAAFLANAVNCCVQTTAFAYEALVRLIEAKQSGGRRMHYVYDILGNRLTKATTMPGAPSNVVARDSQNASIVLTRS